jgi:6-phosphogluconate dehydrogenase (decarboxylating)
MGMFEKFQYDSYLISLSSLYNFQRLIAYLHIQYRYEPFSHNDVTQDGASCVTYIGPNGAGHYVKMVHNGIEYADMPVISIK